MNYIKFSLLIAAVLFFCSARETFSEVKEDNSKPCIAFSFDDSNCKDTPLFGWKEKNQRFLDVLKKYNLQSILYVEGKYIDNPNGTYVLQSWDSAGHLLGNHSYSHLYYPSAKVSFEKYSNDMLRCDSIINKYKNYARLFRFPYLKEGDTKEKRDSFRIFLHILGYSQGYVSVDASDWYVDDRLTAKLKSDPRADLEPYKKFYLEHIYDRATYYNELSRKIFGRQVKHVLLLHHNLVNALFLEDMIKMFREKGWDVINASEAYKDPVYKLEPDVLPAGESIIWSVAHESGKFEDDLRYPAEDAEYEKEKMDKLGL